MHLKSTKKLSFKASKVAKSFTSENLTSYSGLTVMRIIRGLFAQLDRHFRTTVKSATQILNVQLFSAIVFASICGIYRLSKFLEFSKKWVSNCGLRRITIDCDSTEETVFGYQEGAAKGYNPHNKGKKCYHLLICFCSEMKIVLNSWFRPGNIYTVNGIVEFMKQTLAALPQRIQKVFFRADSGFYSGQLFDLLEENGHEYLVKAKLTNPIKEALSGQKWGKIDTCTAVCDFEYRAQGWSKNDAENAQALHVGKRMGASGRQNPDCRLKNKKLTTKRHHDRED